MEKFVIPVVSLSLSSKRLIKFSYYEKTPLLFDSGGGQRLTALALLFLAGSCAKSDVPDQQPLPGEKITVHASTEATRTALGNNHTVVWSKGDSFRLFSDLTPAGQSFTLTDGDGTTAGSFEGMRPAGNAFVAVYPDNGVEYDPAGVFVTMPAVQTYAEGTFAPHSNPMVAHTNDPENLYFTNLCGVIELQITGSATLSSIELHSKDNYLCGRGQVFLSANEDYLLSFRAAVRRACA